MKYARPHPTTNRTENKDGSASIAETMELERANNAYENELDEIDGSVRTHLTTKRFSEMPDATMRVLERAAGRIDKLAGELEKSMRLIDRGTAIRPLSRRSSFAVVKDRMSKGSKQLADEKKRRANDTERIKKTAAERSRRARIIAKVNALRTEIGLRFERHEAKVAATRQAKETQKRLSAREKQEARLIRERDARTAARRKSTKTKK